MPSLPGGRSLTSDKSSDKSSRKSSTGHRLWGRSAGNNRELVGRKSPESTLLSHWLNVSSACRPSSSPNTSEYTQEVTRQTPSPERRVAEEEVVMSYVANRGHSGTKIDESTYCTVGNIDRGPGVADSFTDCSIQRSQASNIGDTSLEAYKLMMQAQAQV